MGLIEVFLANGAFYGNSFGNFLAYAEQAGIFSYILPFLLIFAIVFGILTQVKLFQENRVINGIIALSVSLMALQFHFVPLFFSEIFPRVGVGLAVLLVVLIIFGLFVDPDHKVINYVLMAVAIVIIVVVLFQTFNYLGFSSYSGFLYFYGPQLIPIIIIIVIIGVIVGAGKTKEGVDYTPLLVRPNKK